MLFSRRAGVITAFLFSLLVSVGLHWNLFPLDIQGWHNWRQSQTMWNVRNFVRYDNNIYNPRTSEFNGSNDNLLRLEFPVMQWGIAQVARVTGEEVMTARIIVWIIGAVGLAGFFLLLLTLGFPPWLAVTGTVLLQFSPLFYFYTVSIIPDVLALTAAIWYLYWMFGFFRDERWWQAAAAAAALSLATLAKLPYAMFGIVGLVYVLSHLIRGGRLQQKPLGAGLLHLLLLYPAYRWYAWVMPTWGSSPTLTGIFGYQNNAEENRRIFTFFWEQYIPYDLLSPAVWGLFIVGALFPYARRVSVRYGVYVWSLAIVTIVYAILQSNTITIVHDYYLLPFLPWMYIVITAGAGRLYHWLDRPGWRPVAILVLGVCAAGAAYAAWDLRQERFAEEIGAYYYDMKDIYPNVEALRAVTGEDEKVIVLNDRSAQIFTWLLRRRGYVFSGNSLPVAWIDDMHDNHGVDYLYSNTRTFEADSAVQTRLGPLVLKAGEIHVYRLRD